MIYQKLNRLPKKMLLFLLGVYSKYLSYYLPSSCRFYPSCSQYSYDAIKDHGALRGVYITLMRLLRCHPWHVGGFDPVPPRCDRKKIISEKLCCDKSNSPETNTSINTQPFGKHI